MTSRVKPLPLVQCAYGMAAWRIVIVVIVAAAVAVLSERPDLCSVCDCSKYDKEYHGTHHYDVVCTCKNHQDLDLSHEWVLPTIVSYKDTCSLSVRGCRTVTVRDNLRLWATRVEVTNVTSLVVERGAFRTLHQLEVRGATSVSLAQNNHPDELKVVLLQDAHVVSLDQGTLLSSSTTSLKLVRVTVDQVGSRGISIDNRDLEVLIRDTKIRDIHEKGVKLVAANVTIENSSFGTVGDKGIYLKASNLRLTNNTFRHLQSPSSLRVIRQGGHVTSNQFNSFPRSFSNMHFEEFTGNEFYVSLYSLPEETLVQMTEEHFNNSFLCHCSPEFDFNLTLLDEEHDTLARSVFCISPGCPRSVTHTELLHRSVSSSTDCVLDQRCGGRPFASSSEDPLFSFSYPEGHSFSVSSGDRPFVYLWLLQLLAVITSSR